MSTTPTGPEHLDVDDDKFLQLAEEQGQFGLNMMANPTYAGIFDAMMDDFSRMNGHEPDPNGPRPSQKLSDRFQRDIDAARAARG